MKAWHSWLDKDVCVEVYRHKRNNEKLCLDCLRYWNSWDKAQRINANIVGVLEYKRQNTLGWKM